MSTEAIAVRNNIESLWQPGWENTRVGIVFETKTDLEGNLKLVDPGRDNLIKLAKGLNEVNVVWGWYVGDTANAYKELYGDDAVDRFFEEIGYSDDQKNYGRKLMSVSKSYGFPDKIAEQRVEGLSHNHHVRAQGLKEPQRNKELKRALKLGLNVVEFQGRIHELSGKSKEDAGKKEYPVWHLKFRAFDPEQDNQTQFIEECKQTVEEEFPYYIDPSKGEEREMNEAKQKAVDGLPEDLARETLEKGVALDATAFKDVVKQVKTLHENYVAVEKIFNKGIKDEAKRAEMLEQIKTDGKPVTKMTKEAAKEAVKAYKKEVGEEKEKEKSIEQLVAKIKNEDVRKALLERAANENLTKEQFEPIVQDAIANEMLEEEREKLRQQMEEKLDPEKFREKAAAKLAPKEKKAKLAGASTESLPLGKKSSGASSKKKAKGKQ